MTEQTTKRQNHKWVKGESGTSYLCNIEDLKKLDNPKDQDLKKICVDESDNPHNE